MIEVDITQSLGDVENLLRGIIELRLTERLGSSWIQQCGVSTDRLSVWEERKVIEEKRLSTGRLEERLIFYADFYDLKTILRKHWNHFTEIFDDLKTMMVFLDELEKLRNPNAHRRELLPHQKYLAMGIAGELRTRMIKWRSKMETGQDCFPRIESARDNLGNCFPSEKANLLHIINTGTILRPNDQVDFVATASDPFGQELLFRLLPGGSSWPQPEWSRETQFSFRITEKHIGKIFRIDIQVKSSREYHASSQYDDMVGFSYTVLPHFRGS